MGSVIDDTKLAGSHTMQRFGHVNSVAARALKFKNSLMELGRMANLDRHV